MVKLVVVLHYSNGHGQMDEQIKKNLAAWWEMPPQQAQPKLSRCIMTVMRKTNCTLFQKSVLSLQKVIPTLSTYRHSPEGSQHRAAVTLSSVIPTFISTSDSEALFFSLLNCPTHAFLVGTLGDVRFRFSLCTAPLPPAACYCLGFPLGDPVTGIYKSWQTWRAGHPSRQ